MELKRTVLRLLLAAASLMGVFQVLADAPSVAVTNCAGEAVPNPAYGATTGGHAVWLPGIGTNFVFIPTPGTFIQFPDGTATLTGTVFSKTNLQNGFIVDVQLSGFRTTPPSGSPKKDLSANAYESGGPVDPSTWVYYTSFTGTLTGLDNYAGAVLTLVRTGPAFQVGVGANNKNVNFGASAWFIWTVTHQPDNGTVLTPTGQGDFNIDLFPCNSGEQCVTNAVADGAYSHSMTTHAVFLPGIATDFIFDPSGRFVQSNDGTATLTGLAVSRANPRNAFQVSAHFAGFTRDVPPGSPKKDLKPSAYIENGGPVDPATWSYYTTMNGTLTGVSNYAGAVLNIVRAGPAFQIGVGANGKNAHYGASGWFNWTVTRQPSSGSLPNGLGDFNVDLVDCPGSVVIVKPPTDQTVCPGDTATFSVTAMGTGLTYQWLFGGNPLNGATNSTLILPNVSAADAGIYCVIVTGADGVSVTSCANLVVNENVIVTTPPANQTVCPGDTALFSVIASGTRLTYQWYFGTTLLGGETTATLVLSNVALNQSGTYSVVVSGACAPRVTNSATLTVSTNVIVTTPPVNQTVCSGDTAVFSVSATGSALAYQWYFGGAPLAGQTASTLVFGRVTLDQAGTYSVVVSGACGNPVTNSANLTVNQNTIVTTPPRDRAICAGETALFSVTATGGALTYQWYFGAASLPGATNSVLVVSNATPAQAGIYSVVVSGACASSVTNTATLTVNQNVIVTVPPANQTNFAGSNVTFTVTATGAALRYQWFFGTNVLAGETNSTLALNNITTNQAGTYCVVVSGICGEPATNCATLTIANRPPIANDDSYSTPANVTLTVAAPGILGNDSDPDGDGITALLVSNPTHGTLTLNANGSFVYVPNFDFSGTDTFTYRANDGKTNSNLATVTITVTPGDIVIVTPPANQTNCPGTTASFSVTATGTALRYQWLFGTNVLNGQTNTTLVVTNVSAADAGTYCVVVTGASGSVTNCALLVVNQNVVVVRAPIDRTVCPGATANFVVSATGTALTYQWYFGATPLAGQTASTLVLSNVQPAQAGTYAVVVGGACAPSVTNSATLTVSTNVIVTVPPANQTNCPGATATFSVTAFGTGLRYQWIFGTNILAGQTNSTLIVSNLTAANAGTYFVIVSGTCGGPVTEFANLVVNENVIVTTPPANQTVCPGETATFRVTATGTALSYQWYFGSTPLNGQNGSTLILTNVAPAQAGTYSVVVAGACAPPVTNSATLTVSTRVTVIVPPRDLTVCPESQATFSVVAAGTALRYQWFFFGTNILGGQTNSTLALNSVTSADAGVYSVVVSGACAPAVTNSATLTVSTNIIVTMPPANQTNCPGTTAMFSVTAMGTGLRYQWFFGTNTLANQTNSTLVLSNVTPAQAGTYRVVITGTCDSPVTTFANLVVNQNVIVTTMPINQTVCPGETATFSVTASGTSLTYQWYFGASPLNGQIGSTLVLTNVAPTQAGTYSVVVSGACAPSVTNAALLTVSTNVIVTVPPVSRTNCPEGSVTFAVTAVGTGLRYQWFFGTNLLASQTNSVLLVNNVTAASAGVYSVVMNGTCGGPVTNSATLTVSTNVIVTVPPANQTNCPGTTASFSVIAIGTSLRYQWFFGTNLLVNQTNNALVLSSVTPAQAGTYRVIVSGECGKPVTNSANLVLNENVVVTTPPANRSVCPGETATFSVSATGSALTYQWYFGAGPLVGQTGSTLVLTNVAPAQAGTYRVVVSGACAPPVTNSATLTLSTNVIVTVPPANQTNCPGTTATFSVTAVGADLRYQWFFGTNVLAGQTNSTLVLSNVTPAQAGTYRVVVTGACGSPVTDSATLTVNQNVIVTTPPANQTVCPGQTATFSVSATGTALAYQWYFGAGPLVGQTGSTLVLTNVAPAQAGTYRVVVSGACAPPVTNSATLTVSTNVIVTVPPANQTNCPGTTASFSVTALGTALRYQWIFGTNVLAGQTNSTLVLSNVSVADAGTYFVIVSGACGNPVTNFANLVISQNVIITTPPANQTSFVGSNAVFSVSASGSGLTFQWIFNGAVVGTNATLTLTNLAPNQAGMYCVIVSGICGPRTTNCATLTLVNRPPVARDDAYSTLEDVPLVIAAPGVLINDTDPDSDTLTAILLAGPSQGTLVLSNNGSFVYVPATNFNGLDSFTYRAFDGLLFSSPAVVRITVVPTNDPPVALDDSYTTPENTTLSVPTLGVLANDFDVDGDPLMAILVAGPTNGTVTLFPNGSFTYVPRTNFFGVDVFTYRASDGPLQSGVARVTITVTKVFQPPTVMIVSPTNGSTFIAPANFAVIADAMDLDGVVTNVQIFSSTNLIGNFTNAPYLVLQTNLPPGIYTYFATATDDDGLRATSSVVSIVVTSTPPVTAVGPLVLDRDTGLFSQFVRVSNPTPQDFVNGVRIFVHLPPALTNFVAVWNATGTNANGLPYVDSPTPIPSGSSSIVLIQYYNPTIRVVPTNVVLTAEPLPFGPAPMPQPTLISISQSAGGTTVEFTTEGKCMYYLQCSDDLIHWHTVPGVIKGTGNRMQCTEPGSVTRRFYRVMVFR